MRWLHKPRAPGWPPWRHRDRNKRSRNKGGCAMSATLNQLQQFVKHSRRGRKSLSEKLMGLIFERATPALLGHFTPDALSALGEQALAFLNEPGELKVRVYNPTLKTHGWVVPYTVLELSLPDRPFIV